MFKTRSTITQLLFCLTIIQFMVIWLLVKRNVIPPEVPLWYTKPWGEDQLAPGSYLWFLPGLGMLVLVVNLFLAKVFFRRERVLSQILILISTLVSFLLGFAFWRIVWLIA